MSPLRRRIAKRLVQAQQNAALLTTFNEIDMSSVIELRAIYHDAFLGKYATRLGFMSFFVRAVVEALKQVPEVNAEIRGEQIVRCNYYDIGVAVGGGHGLVAGGASGQAHACGGGVTRRNFYDHQRRGLRIFAVYADRQSTAKRRPWP
ncbi:MAG TPA: 2-oxo acid dehydrogenase subunit E2, partial [Terriglobales bacterium]|nr:2-oxo acid dehydrogenase subunit E2 [Terriglobales bacterium]